MIEQREYAVFFEPSDVGNTQVVILPAAATPESGH
jgi:hypothetical protein